MTVKDNDDSRDDVDWLKEAFDRAIRGDNGTAPDSTRPVVSPFSGLIPTRDTAPIEPGVQIEPGIPTVPQEPVEMPSHRHDLDLDFETDDMPPVTVFEPVVPLDHSLPTVATDYPPTEVLDAIDLPATPVSEPVPPHSPVVTPPATPSEPTSGIDQIDALFSSTDTSAATAPITALRISPQPETVKPTRKSKPVRELTPVDVENLRRRLLLIVGGIVVVIISIGAFLAGRLVALPAAAPAVDTTGAPTTARPPGEYTFSELFGGECLDPFDTAWASTFTVVNCATPHSAQLVYAGDLAVDRDYAAYPGDDLIGNAALAECSRRGILNLSSAKTYSDLLVSAAYPMSSEVWDSGDNRYYCFVTLSSGVPINGDLAGTLITPAAEASPEPTATP